MIDWSIPINSIPRCSANAESWQKKKKEKGESFRKEQYTVVKIKSHMRIMTILYLYMKQDKGACGYVGSA